MLPARPLPQDLGWIEFYHGLLGTPKDYAKALEWYTKAADQGNALAQFYIGGMYEEALVGVKRDYATAYEWYQKAAQQANTDAGRDAASRALFIKPKAFPGACCNTYDEAKAYCKRWVADREHVSPEFGGDFKFHDCPHVIIDLGYFCETGQTAWGWCEVTEQEVQAAKDALSKGQ